MLTIQNNPDITLKSNERMLIALRALAKEEGQITPAPHNMRVKASTIIISGVGIYSPNCVSSVTATVMKLTTTFKCENAAARFR